MKAETGVSLGDLLTMATVVLGAAAIVLSILQLRSTLRQGSAAILSAHYSELDRLYTDLLAYIIERPHLRKLEPLKSDDDASQGRYEPFPSDHPARASYDAYAHMVWCFIETLHDRCMDLDDPDATEESKAKREFRLTWATAIDVEDALHRGWFLDSEVAGQKVRKFRPGFIEFVRARQWKTDDWAYRC
ncbi:hypothetical protein [Terricaulis sp.]|uniref:hypothetical protein n=1 Tax=Terricaulis sp. TaxID=2768686 RepID=UPI002AC51E10|nr:hypothetical protein [Terricaulis sp.]MDZ4689701.1 hypothetical protein [Terricaulis sp.]